MQKDFEKFKKRVWLHILIKCAVAAVLTGFTLVSAVLLPCRLFGVKIFWLWYVLIALGGMALGGGIAFFVLKTTDKKIAGLIDGELNLAERVVTAYDYSSYRGEMYSAQREDAAAALASLPAKSLPFKNLVATAICGVLAVAMVVAVPVIGFTVPAVFATVEPVEQPEPPRPVTDWEWDALDDLIEYVKNSKKADAESKEAMLTQLNGLRNVLLDGVTASSLSSFVQSAVTNIRNAIREINAAVSEEQQAANTEESNYVISRLYEIFDIKSPIEDDGSGNGDPEKPDDNKKPSTGGNAGTGELNVSDLPFFDRVDGEVKCGDKRDEYYARAQQALEEGLITGEEWRLIVATYFTDLNDKNE